MNELNVVNAPKTATFQMRINPDVKRMAEETFARQGLTLTEAINVFIQQSLNAGGMPFILSKQNSDEMRRQAQARMLAELQAGWDSVQSEDDWVSEDEVKRRFGVR